MASQTEQTIGNALQRTEAIARAVWSALTEKDRRETSLDWPWEVARALPAALAGEGYAIVGPEDRAAIGRLLLVAAAWAEFRGGEHDPAYRADAERLAALANGGERCG